jgi:predicted dehydrogenase
MAINQPFRSAVLTRRDALRAGALATLPLLAARAAQTPREQTIRIAQIGVGNQGHSDLHSVATAPRSEIVALCDVDQDLLDVASREFTDAHTFRDYRKLLAEMATEIDAVVVSTPDHMHVAIAVAAMLAGKHVYLQKPLAHNLAELRRLVEVAGEMGVVTQMGTQIHGHEAYRTAVKLLREGVLGQVHEAHSWIGGSRTAPDPSKLGAADPIPATLDWDLWQGVAPPRPFARGVYHPFNWRNWRDYGGGTLGDMGCHLLDPIFGGLDLRPPIAVESYGPPHPKEVFASDADVRFTFAGTPMTAETFALRWTHGAIAPDAAAAQLPPGTELPGSGSFVVGERGVMVLPHWGMPSLYTRRAPLEVEVKSAGNVDHYHEWVAACRGDATTSTPFSYSGMVTEAVLVGTLAGNFPGQKLKWNSADLTFNDSEADALIRRTYRDGWRPEGL